MSEENAAPAEGAEESAAPPPQEDPIKNVKEEFSRKMNNMNETLSQVMEKLNTLAQPAPVAPANDKKRLADLLYSDPEAYVEEIEKRAADKAAKMASQQVEGRMNQQNAINSTVAAIHNQYPELGQQDSEAFKSAIAKFQALPKYLQGTPEGAKIALLETVSELGLIPQSKRKSVKNDDFSLSGGGSSKGGARDVKPSAKDLDPNTLAAAQLMGLNVDDPKVVERLKSYKGGKRG